MPGAYSRWQKRNNMVKNKYFKVYRSIYKRAKRENRTRKNGEYFENHHIVPRALGGSNSKINRVLLTPREHYIMHACLVRFLTGQSKYKMVHALMFFGKDKYKMNSHIYEYLKRSLSKSMTENNPLKGRVNVINSEGKWTTITSEEFHSNNNYKCSANEHVICKDKYCNVYMIPKEEYELRNDLVGINKDMLSVRDKSSRKCLIISKDDFDPTIHTGVGSRQYLIKDEQGVIQYNHIGHFRKYLRELKLPMFFFNNINKGPIKFKNKNLMNKDYLKYEGWLVEQIKL